jgi:hypothetical protein
MGLPVGVQNGTMLGMVLHVGSSLLSAEVTIQFEVTSDWKGLTVAASMASENLQSMLVSSQVCLSHTIAFHAICCPCGSAVAATILCSAILLFEDCMHDQAACRILSTMVLEAFLCNNKINTCILMVLSQLQQQADEVRGLLLVR